MRITKTSQIYKWAEKTTGRPPQSTEDVLSAALFYAFFWGVCVPFATVVGLCAVGLLVQVFVLDPTDLGPLSVKEALRLSWTGLLVALAGVAVATVLRAGFLKICSKIELVK